MIPQTSIPIIGALFGPSHGPCVYPASTHALLPPKSHPPSYSCLKSTVTPSRQPTSSPLCAAGTANGPMPAIMSTSTCREGEACVLGCVGTCVKPMVAPYWRGADARHHVHQHVRGRMREIGVSALAKRCTTDWVSPCYWYGTLCAIVPHVRCSEAPRPRAA